MTRNDDPTAEHDKETSPQTEDVPDALTTGDGEHFTSAQATPGAREFLAVIRSGLSLVEWVLQSAPVGWKHTLPNDFSAAACFGRSVRQVRAATLLAHFGYYGEVAHLLRGAYESGATARYLAHNTKEAESWLRKEEWYPQKKVRRWFGDDESIHSEMYRFLSAFAHPTARSCAEVIHEDVEADGYTVETSSTYDEQAFLDALRLITGMTLWLAFAVRNATPDEGVLPADWRERLADLARQYEPDADWSHLDRDWLRERGQWERMQAKVRRETEAETLIDKHPGSWRNLKKNIAGQEKDALG